MQMLKLGVDLICYPIRMLRFLNRWLRSRRYRLKSPRRVMTGIKEIGGGGSSMKGENGVPSLVCNVVRCSGEAQRGPSAPEHKAVQG